MVKNVVRLGRAYKGKDSGRLIIPEKILAGSGLDIGDYFTVVIEDDKRIVFQKRE